MPPKGTTKATAGGSKATAVKKIAIKEKDHPVSVQAQCFRNLMKYRSSELCTKAGTVLGVHGIKIHIAKPG